MQSYLLQSYASIRQNITEEQKNCVYFDKNGSDSGSKVPCILYLNIYLYSDGEFHLLD